MPRDGIFSLILSGISFGLILFTIVLFARALPHHKLALAVYYEEILLGNDPLTLYNITKKAKEREKARRKFKF